MLNLTLQQGEFIKIGENVKVIFSGGSSNNIHLLIDAPREISIERSNTRANKKKNHSKYYKEQGLSEEAKKEIASIIKWDKSRKV